MYLQDCNHVKVENVKIIGGEAQTDDGINTANAQDIVINNCLSGLPKRVYDY